MSQAIATPEQVIAHLDLLRAVEKLLREAETVRQKRDVFMRTAPPAINDRPQEKAAAR